MADGADHALFGPAALVADGDLCRCSCSSLPAGVLADTADRRRLLLGSLAMYARRRRCWWRSSPPAAPDRGTLLLFSFLMGACTAMLSPAWNSSVGDTISRAELPQAITMISMAYNGARAPSDRRWPAWFSRRWAAASSFAIAVASALVMLQSIRLWPPGASPGICRPSGCGGMLAGLRFARHSPTILAQLVRTVAFSATGSALMGAAADHRRAAPPRPGARRLRAC